MSKFERRLSVALLFAFMASLMLTSVAFADGTIPEGGTPGDPEVTETRDGCRRSDFGSSQTNACGEGVEVTADQAADSPEAPEGWHYVGHSMTITYSELLLPEPAMMCWAVPAGEEEVQIYRLNQFGAWEPVPTIKGDGTYCTLAFFTGTYAPLAPN